jgi:SAM-dependent methyltransferase
MRLFRKREYPIKEEPIKENPIKENPIKENDRIIDYWNRAAERDPMRETVSQWADETDDQYHQRWIEEGAYVANKILAAAPPNPVALEIGAGLGRITIPMLRQCQSVLALDISPQMAKQTAKAMANYPQFEVQVIRDQDLAFLPPDHFDLAYSIACFQHAEKKSFYRYLRGIRAALKPDGVLFFGVMNLCSDRGWGHFEAIVSNDYPEFFHTPEEISCYLRHAGYRTHSLADEGETLWAVAYR